MTTLASSSSMAKNNSVPLLTTVASLAAVSVSSYIFFKKSKQQKKIKKVLDEEENGDLKVSSITIPQWAKEEYNISPSSMTQKNEYLTDKIYENDEEMMQVAVDISDKNVKENSGGPFGTAIFERFTNEETGKEYCKLFAIGMNRVVPLCNSTLHGETVAIQMAQAKLGTYSMNCIFIDDDKDAGAEKKKRKFELFTSCEPCAMCVGASVSFVFFFTLTT